MNISLHTRVKHLLKKERERERGCGKWVRDTWWETKVGDIEMHEESSQFPLRCPVFTVSYAPPTHSLVYCDRRAACEYPVLSCDVVSVEMCVRKRWFMMGVWWEWKVMSCYCRRCHKMFVSSTSQWMIVILYSLHPTSVGELAEESSTLPPPRLACICISVMWGGIHWQIGCLQSQPRL